MIVQCLQAVSKADVLLPMDAAHVEAEDCDKAYGNGNTSDKQHYHEAGADKVGGDYGAGDG